MEQSTPALIPTHRAPSSGSGTRSGTTESRKSNSRAASRRGGPRMLEYDPAKVSEACSDYMNRSLIMSLILHLYSTLALMLFRN